MIKQIPSKEVESYVKKNPKTLTFLTKMEKSKKTIYSIPINVLSAKITQMFQNKTQYSKSYSQYTVA